MKKGLSVMLVISVFMLIGTPLYAAISSTGWHVVSWNKSYLYPNGQNDTNTYLKYYFTDEGHYDAINVKYASGGSKEKVRAKSKDGGNQLTYGEYASSRSGYPKNSYTSQGAQRGDDYVSYQIKK